MAITERYVSSAGGGLHDGTSEANAFTWAEMVADINTPRVGYRYWVKGAISLTGTTTITGDGDANSPNIIAGYNATIGDVTFLRGSDGKLIETNMPVVTYDDTFSFVASSATNLLLCGLKIIGNRSGALVNIAGTDSSVFGCIITNNSSNSSAVTLQVGTSSPGNVTQNDLYMPNGVTGAAVITGGWRVSDNRIEGSNQTIGCLSSVTAVTRYERNTIIGCLTGISKTHVSANLEAYGNTIVGCAGDGINVVTSTVGRCIAYGNHITGCGGYGINFNTSTCVKLLAANRFRDNTSGTISGGGDYETATRWMHITSDDTDADDFADAGSDIYSLKSTAAGYQKGLGFLNNIGAAGSTVSGGGSAGGPFVNGKLVQ